MNKKILIALPLFSLLLNGCVFFDFDEPRVTSSSPHHLEYSVGLGREVRVVFSEEMDKNKTEDAFSLSDDDGELEGSFRWKGKEMVFSPARSLIFGGKYYVVVDSSAEDIHANNLKDSYEIQFYTGNEIGEPTVVSHTPAYGELVLSDNTPIVVEFSEDLLPESIYDGFSLSPDVSGEITLVGGRNLVFTPFREYNYGTQYTVSLNENIQDLAGNSLFEPYSFSFTIGDDFIRPQITSVTAELIPLVENTRISGVSKNDTITILFSEEIDAQSLSSGILISPSAPRLISTSLVGTATEAVITFTEPLDPETEYEISFNSGITDVNGNSLDRTYTYLFFTDSPVDSVRPQVLGVRQAFPEDSSGLCASSVSCSYVGDTASGTCDAATQPCEGLDMAGTPEVYPSTPGDYLLVNDVLHSQEQVDFDTASLDAIVDYRLVLIVYFNNAIAVSSLSEGIAFEPIVSGESVAEITDVALYDPQTAIVYIKGYTGDAQYYQLRVKADTVRDVNGNTLEFDYILPLY